MDGKHQKLKTIHYGTLLRIVIMLMSEVCAIPDNDVPLPTRIEQRRGFSIPIKWFVTSHCRLCQGPCTYCNSNTYFDIKKGKAYD
jgi:hypothetical protein